MVAPIDESNLVDTLPAFRPYRYGHDVSYPWPLLGVGAIDEPGRFNDCCTFVEALTVRAFEQGAGGAFSWGKRRHGQMMIVDTKDRFSPVTAVVEAEIADRVDPDAAPGPWTLVQGWKQRWKGGHTFLLVDHDPSTDRVLLLESNKAFGLDGPGLRGLGNLRDLDGGPPPAWWTQPAVWTWAQVKQAWPYRKAARLRVEGTRWSGR